MADCESCFHYSYPDRCNDCNNGSNFKEIKITNADRIRAMSDEELARFIHRIDHYFNYEEYIWVVRFEDKEIEDNQINILEWLQS